MAQTKTIQLLRSATLYASKEAAKSAILARTANDGEVILARYQSGTDSTSGDLIAKSLLGIYHANPDLTPASGSVMAGWTIIEDSSTVDAILEGLDFTTGNMTFEGSTATDDSVIVVGVAQNNGQLDAVVAELGSVKINSVTATSATSKIAADQTLTENLGRLQGQIDAMDLTAVGGASGDVITTVSQADGKVSASKSSLTDVAMTGYSKTSDTGAIAATDTLEEAFSKVENSLGAVTVKSTDKTVIITDNSGKDLSVNIDNTTLVKNSSTGVISADLSVVKLNSTEVTALSDANVKEAYKLIYSTDSNRTAIGDVVKVYKDSALQNVYMGHVDDTLSGQDTTTHESSSSTVVSGTGDDALCFVYQLANGNYKLESVNVQAFLKETEFKDGLTVDTSNHTVSVKVGNGLELGTAAADGNKPVQVKIDSTSEKVITAYGSTNTQSDVLSVGANGVKVSNIQATIDAKVGTLDVTDTAVAGQYVSAVNETDGKVSMTRANVADAVLTGYSKGSAPASGSEAVAATDDVKGAIAKLEHQVDAAVSAASTAVSGLDGTADAANAESGYTPTVPTADFQVLTKVVETDGVVQAVGATNGSTSATLKKLAATGAAADVSIADSGSLIDATTVEGALQEIAGKANTALQSVSSGNGAISVGTKSNNDQTVSLVLDTTTASHNITSDMLSITSNGLMMSDTWDCGTF